MQKVLIAGQGPRHQDILLKCLLLETGRYQVEIPANGAALIETLKKDIPHVIVLNLKHLSGYLTNLIAKVNQMCPDSAILVLSFDVDASCFDSLVQERVYFLQQPVSHKQFVRAVDTVGGNQRAPTRNSPRFPVSMETLVRLSEHNVESNMTITDIGYFGLQGEVRGEVVHVGDRVQVQWPDGSNRFEGQVRWMQEKTLPRRQIFGVQFDQRIEQELYHLLTRRKPAS